MIPTRPAWLRPVQDGILIDVTVIPGARRSGVSESASDRLRIRVAAPAVEGRANEALIAFVSELVARRPRIVSIRRGTTSRHKTLHLSGDPETLADQLVQAVVTAP